MPKPIRRALYLLSASEELAKSLRAIVDLPYAIHRVQDWTELKRALVFAPPSSICFADAISAVGSEWALAEGVREVAQEFPLLALVACAPMSKCSAEVLDALQSWGVAEFLDLEKEQSASAIARRLDLVRLIWAQRLFMRALPRTLSARGRILLEAVADVFASGGYVKELGDALGISRGTVTRWCSAAGVPEPRRMFGWIRLLLAALLLDEQRHSIEQVAHLSGFTSGASLKSTAKTFTSRSPSELRDQGAFEIIAGLARAEFRATREQTRASKQHKNSWYN